MKILKYVKYKQALLLVPLALAITSLTVNAVRSPKQANATLAATETTSHEAELTTQPESAPVENSGTESSPASSSTSRVSTGSSVQPSVQSSTTLEEEDPVPPPVPTPPPTVVSVEKRLIDISPANNPKSLYHQYCDYTYSNGTVTTKLVATVPGTPQGSGLGITVDC